MKKLFVLLPRVPWPLEKGDKLRAYHQIRELSKYFEIYLCALNDNRLHADAIDTLKNFCKEVHVIKLPVVVIALNLVKAFFQGTPLQVGYFYNGAAKKKVHALIERINPDHIFCQLVRTAEYVKDIKASKTIDYQDVFSAGVARRIKTAPVLLKPLLNIEYQRLKKYEKKVFSWFDNKTIISVPDRNLIDHPQRDYIKVIPNGVDSNYFKPLQRDKTHDILFSGNMNYPPNINAAEFLVKKIIPIVKKKKADISVMIAGANPSERIKALASDYVTITGWVDDMRECYASAKIFVAPMQIGTGLQNKLLEAMAMALPCITSSMTNQALKAAENEEILIGSSPRDYAEKILLLLNNKDLHQKIASNGHALVLEKFDWEKITLTLKTVIESTGEL